MPIFIFLGFKTRFAAGCVSGLLFSAAFAKPFPWFHEKIASVPMGIVISKEISFAYAFAYLAIVLMGPGRHSLDSKKGTRKRI